MSPSLKKNICCRHAAAMLMLLRHALDFDMSLCILIKQTLSELAARCLIPNRKDKKIIVPQKHSGDSR